MKKNIHSRTTWGIWPLRIVFFLALASLLSCSTMMRSGHHIMVMEGDTMESLAEEFQVSLADLRSANKNREFLPGDWIFIPTQGGILPKILEGSGYYRNDYDSEGLYKGSLLWPVPSSSKISSYFGERDGRPHNGIDIPAPRGANILAAEEGKVIHSGRNIKGYGNMTIIAHNGGVYTVYAHARKNFTQKGQQVMRGQVIAEIGSTGHATGPHLHFEVRMSDNAVDPMDYFSRNLADGGFVGSN